MSDVICTKCNDSHQEMRSGREVPCQYCPAPCEKCRQYLGAFCVETPCSCTCHNAQVFGPYADRKRKPAQPSVSERGVAALTAAVQDARRARFDWANAVAAGADVGELFRLQRAFEVTSGEAQRILASLITKGIKIPKVPR